MSTRSVVAIPTGAGSWKGRYIHFDGYPDCVGESLREIVLRDGYTKAVKTLVEDRYGWSCVNPHIDEEMKNMPNHEVGYGRYYSDSESTDWEESTDTESWSEYAYVLGESGIEVYTPGSSKPWEKRAFVRYDDAEKMKNLSL